MDALEAQLGHWSRGAYFIDVFRNHVEEIRTAHTAFADDESRRVFREILQAYATVQDDQYAHLQAAAADACPFFHFTHEPDGYRVCGTENPYFLADIFPFREPVVLLDGGAYTGDTLEQAYRQLGDKLAFYYAFEPNAGTFAQLQETAGRLPVAGRLFNQGLGDATGPAAFLAEGSRSRVVGAASGAASGEGAGEGAGAAATATSAGAAATNISLVATGPFAESADPRPTFVKLDVEGLEPVVLRSLAGFIAQYQPDLAISAYHELAHLWEIPLQIRQMNPGYRLYLRHQSNFYTETICYAHAG